MSHWNKRNANDPLVIGTVRPLTIIPSSFFIVAITQPRRSNLKISVINGATARDLHSSLTSSVIVGEGRGGGKEVENEI